MSPRDFLSDDYEMSPKKAKASKKLMPKDFLMDDQQTESFSEQLPKDIMIGLSQAGLRGLNTPHDVGMGIANQGLDFNQLVRNAMPLEKYGVKDYSRGFDQENPTNSLIANQIPHFEERNFPDIYGQQGEPTFPHQAIQKGLEYAPDILSLGGLFKGVLPHLTRRGASRRLREAKQSGIEKNIGNQDINHELINDMSQFLPDNKFNRKLIEKAKNGDYQSLFNLQSQVGKQSAALSRALPFFAPESKLKGAAGFKARNAFLEDIHRALQEKGHHDISELLRKGQRDYRRYSKFKPYRNAIGAAGLALSVPKNPLTDLLKKLAFHSQG